MTTFTWKIDSIMSHDEMFDKQDVVFAVNFRVIASNESGSYNVIHSSAAITYNSDGSYKDISELDETELLEWVKSSLSDDAKTELEQKVGSKIDKITIRTL